MMMMMMMVMMRTEMMRHDEDDEARSACFQSYLRLLSSGIAKPTSMTRSLRSQKCVFTAQATRNVISQHPLRAHHEDRLYFYLYIYTIDTYYILYTNTTYYIRYTLYDILYTIDTTYHILYICTYLSMTSGSSSLAPRWPLSGPRCARTPPPPPARAPRPGSHRSGPR